MFPIPCCCCFCQILFSAPIIYLTLHWFLCVFYKKIQSMLDHVKSLLFFYYFFCLEFFFFSWTAAAGKDPRSLPTTMSPLTSLATNRLRTWTPGSGPEDRTKEHPPRRWSRYDQCSNLLEWKFWRSYRDLRWEFVFAVLFAYVLYECFLVLDNFGLLLILYCN